MKISTADQKILMDFLKDLSNRYSRAGCNDYTLPALSPEQTSQLRTDVLQFVQLVPDLENEDPIFAAQMVLGNDMLLVHYLIHKIEGCNPSENE